MAEIAEPVSITRRSLILRDSVAFLSLVAITVLLFTITLFLFRSFMTHRVDLAKRWSERGSAALHTGQPREAVAAFRAALSYAPGKYSYELMLAQALADAGRTEEAYNYFTELWETHPGDGFINLQLARLAARKAEVQDAVNDYRASIYGTWEGDGVERRREVRLELARYLISQHQMAAARVELLIAGGNAPDTLQTDLTLAKLLEQADTQADALNFYQKALVHDPRNAQALAGAGSLAYAMGDYVAAHRFLQRASRETQDKAIDPVLLSNSERMVQLLPSDTLPVAERVSHIMTLREIAKKRLSACIAELGAKPELPVTLEALQARWASGDATTSRAGLMRNMDKQNAIVDLAYETELSVSHLSCSAATGDDALLLMLAKSAATEEAQHR